MNQIEKLKKICDKYDKDRISVFVGLIHARLIHELMKSHTGSHLKGLKGFYRAYAIPSSTVFVPANEIVRLAEQEGVKNRNTQSSNFNLYLSDIYPRDTDISDSYFPECSSRHSVIYIEKMFRYTIITTTEIYRSSPLYRSCRTCGGFNYPSHCKLMCNSSKLEVSCYSLAQLLSSLSSRTFGYEVKDPERELPMIMREYQNLTCSLMLIYSSELDTIFAFPMYVETEIKL